MTFPSYVAEAAADAVREAADEISTPAAAELAAEADTVVFDPRELAEGLMGAIVELEDLGRIGRLAEDGLDLGSVPITTANRQRQADNQAALVDLVRGLATVRLAQRTAVVGFTDREAAFASRDRVSDTLDARAAGATGPAFSALRALRAAVNEHVVSEAQELPQVTTATPAAVVPALALAYDVHDDLAMADEIATRNRLPRPGFVPARPIQVLSG